MVHALVLLSGWAWVLLANTGIPAPVCQAQLQAVVQNGMLYLTGTCSSQGAVAGHYRYEMSLEKRSAAGSSMSRQGGEFDLPAGGSVVMARSTVNINDNSTYIGQLRIFDAHNLLLAQDSVRHEPGPGAGGN